jgi:hypothetical protein
VYVVITCWNEKWKFPTGNTELYSITVTNTKGRNSGRAERSSGRVRRNQASQWQSRIIVNYDSTDNVIRGTRTVISRWATTETRKRNGNEKITLTVQETLGRILENKWNFLPERKQNIYINKFSLKWFLCLLLWSEDCRPVEVLSSKLSKSYPWNVQRIKSSAWFA